VDYGWLVLIYDYLAPFMNLSKDDVITRSAEVIASKKQTLITALQLLEESLLSETKSSAGDKHETGRARVQAEQDKLLGVLNEVLELEKFVNQLKQLPEDSPQKGALMSTDKGLFYLGLSLGRIEVKGETVFIISAGSPLGAALRNKKPGDDLEFRNVKYKVLDVW
jgi:hypothetical protein